MKTSSKALSFCLAFGLILMVGSVASAGWAYVATTPTTTVVQYAAPTTYVYGPTVYSYPAPIVTVPTLVPPVRVVRPAPIVVHTRPMLRPRVHRVIRVW